jgi:hypothetical protein
MQSAPATSGPNPLSCVTHHPLPNTSRLPNNPACATRTVIRAHEVSRAGLNAALTQRGQPVGATVLKHRPPARKGCGGAGEAGRKGGGVDIDECQKMPHVMMAMMDKRYE